MNIFYFDKSIVLHLTLSVDEGLQFNTDLSLSINWLLIVRWKLNLNKRIGLNLNVSK